MMNKTLAAALLLLCSAHNLIAQDANNSLHFESNDYVQLDAIAQDVSNLNEFTIEFWVKFDSEANDDYNTFYAVNASNYGNRFLIRFAGPVDGVADAAVVYINDGSNQYIIGSTPIGDKMCHHIAFTYNNAACSLYVDGQLDGSGNYTNVFQPTDLHSLGQEYDMTANPTSAFYNGELDDFRFWNTAKTLNEINALKDVELLGNEPNLLAYFNFNQGVAGGNNTSLSSLNNSTQPTQNGTLINFNLNGSSSNFVASNCPDLEASTSEEALNAITVYPNPTSGLLTVSNHEAISSIVVKNLLGQTVLSLEPNSTIDISSLPNANYFIELSTKEGRKSIRKVFKL